MESRTLAPLGPLRPSDLPSREEIEAFLAADFPRIVPGFSLSLFRDALGLVGSAGDGFTLSPT